ncbi:MAG: BatA domain-containing protein [Vicinamibacterales bacterium]
MTFLAPFLLAGLATIAVPIFVHLIQRERTRVVHFPSLMFVQKIPYQSVQRRRLRHWFLLLMRCAAIALIVAAFARPFFPRGAAATLAAIGGSREVVVLLDQSASMGYGDHWQRAKDAATLAINQIGVADRATLVVFNRNAEERIRATSDRGRLEGTLRAAQLTDGGTRFGPALKLAESILTRSTLQRREAILISDFQKTGWTGSEDVHFGEGVTLTPISVASTPAPNIAVPSVTFTRTAFQNQERIAVTAGIANKGAAQVNGVPVTLEIGGRQLEAQTVNIAPNSTTSVTFAPFTLTEPSVQGVVKTGSDQLAADNSFDFVINPSQSVSVLVIDSGANPTSSFYLTRALAIGNTPTFQVETVAAARVTPQMLERRTVVVLNDTMVPPGLAGGALKSFVERGGGLLIVFGARTTWPQNETALLPGTLGTVIDRADGRGATIGFRDYSHPVFEIFKAPRSGDFSAARVLHYRALTPGPTDRVLARYDDGAAAAVEKRVGAGRVVAWTTTVNDEWSDLALKPVFLPLVHQLTRYLSQFEQTPSWSTVGQAVDLSMLLKTKADRVVMTPSDERRPMGAGDSAVLELAEHGVYQIRSASSPSAPPDRIAVNIDPAESDLTPIDPAELVAAVTGHAASTPTAAGTAAAELTAEEAEKHQNLWWYLLVAGLLMLTAETVVANRLSTKERFT